MTTPTYDFMFCNLRDYITNNSDDITPTEAAMMLMDFEGTHGIQAVKNMYGFKRYCETQKDSRFRNKPDERERAIRSAIFHDINGRNDATMLPRTTSYGEFVSY
jgi:hypothetical protein